MSTMWFGFQHTGYRGFLVTMEPSTGLQNCHEAGACLHHGRNTSWSRNFSSLKAYTGFDLYNLVGRDVLLLLILADEPADM
jgi:hypothetical protein